MTLSNLFSLTRTPRHVRPAYRETTAEGAAPGGTVERRQKVSLRRLYGMLPDEAQGRLRTSDGSSDGRQEVAA